MSSSSASGWSPLASYSRPSVRCPFFMPPVREMAPTSTTEASAPAIRRTQLFFMVISSFSGLLSLYLILLQAQLLYKAACGVQCILVGL